MIETMVALTILVIIGTAIISLTLTVIAANTSAKLRNQGLGFAEEGLEQTRDYFQTNGYLQLYGLTGGSTVCYKDGRLDSVANNTISCPPDPAQPPFPVPPDCLLGAATSNSNFYRSVWLTRGADLSVRVRSVATWTDRKACRFTEVGTYFYSY